MNTDLMQIFLRVADLSSFTDAAQAIGLPKASISTAVQRLERSLGTRLLHRTTRRVRLTQDGQAYYERCKDLLADLDELQAMFQTRGATLTGRLRVDMPINVARSLVMPRLPEFLREHPQLQVEVSSTDRLVDLVREGFDCVLRVGLPGDSTLVARPLGTARLINCASPAYVAAFGLPASLEDLASHQLVHYVPTLGRRSPGFEYVDAADKGHTRFVPMAGAVTVDNSEAYVAACEAGLGLIQAPESGLRPRILNGQLVEVLPQWRPAPMRVSLLYANRRHLPMRVQVFMDWLGQVMTPYVTA